MTETNEERMKQADELLTAVIEMGDGHGKHKEGIDVLEWLIQQAERVQELENEKPTPPVEVIKRKKGKPTVIMYEGRRFIQEQQTRGRKAAKKNGES